MSSKFYKDEISNIASEMIRIVDRIGEMNDECNCIVGRKENEQFEWPPYCESYKSSSWSWNCEKTTTTTPS